MSNTEDIDLEMIVSIPIRKKRQNYPMYHDTDCGKIANSNRVKRMKLGEVRHRPYQPAQCLAHIRDCD